MNVEEICVGKTYRGGKNEEVRQVVAVETGRYNVMFYKRVGIDDIKQFEFLDWFAKWAKEEVEG